MSDDKNKVKFVSGEKASEDADIYNSSELAQNLSHMLRVKKQHEDILSKSVRPKTTKRDSSKKYDQSKIVFSSRAYEKSMDGAAVKGWQRLSDNELREVAHVDPYISAIISTRCSQGAVIARESESKFDKGTRILDINPPDINNFDNIKDYETQLKVREQQSRVIMDWIWNCGTRDEEIINEVFSDPGSDKLFKKCTLADWMSSQMRNLLTFGRKADQIIRNQEGLPIMFRPLPVETIQPLIGGRDAYVGTGKDTVEQSEEDAKEFNEMPVELRPAAFVQKIEGRNANFFTEDELKMSYFQKQALFDLNEYPMSPIEMTIYMVFIHQNTLSYLRNQFVKGLGTKGVLALQSTDPSASLGDEDLESLRRDFHNFLSRTDNSAATPVIAGPVSVNWIPLTSSPRDMEFLQVEEHVIRALCAAFQTSPQEMGYGHLSINQGGLNQGNKQDDIIQGEERGLRMLLDILYDDLNDILYENFPEARDNFRISYTGVGEDTRDAVIQRDTAELQTTATMSSLWANSEKKDAIPAGADVPLASIFHSNIVRYMKYGFFMEQFFGFEGWEKDPQYDFIIDAGLESSRQQRIMFNNNMLQQQGQIQLQTQAVQLDSMEQQAKATEAQNAAMEQQMQAQQQQGQQPQDEQQAQEGDPQQQDQGGSPQSMRDAYVGQQQAQKSLSPLEKSTRLKSYFSEWIKAHKEE